ncbi:hypothetical protein QEJ31_13030 [Pigmentibacter sp. JX0631]|uniref:hypothetical protein n=1 Tax=Pigmentibacter sp. JX0631 TaxID=2976982 RepID=UPI0024682761|nr:hypothetical protein [Pigmentibacter sp. JX0631]WGL59447.1 hypothetical protein QEJ31_13030 [Pigmentibacter sp. JX0631]
MKYKINYNYCIKIKYLNFFLIFFLYSCSNKNSEQNQSNSNSQASPGGTPPIELVIPEFKDEGKNPTNDENTEIDDINENVANLEDEKNKLPINSSSIVNDNELTHLSDEDSEVDNPTKNTYQVKNIKLSDKIYPILEEDSEYKSTLEESLADKSTLEESLAGKSTLESDSNQNDNKVKNDKSVAKNIFEKIVKKISHKKIIQKLKSHGEKVKKQENIGENENQENNNREVELQEENNVESNIKIAGSENETKISLQENKIPEKFNELKSSTELNEVKYSNDIQPSAPLEDENLITYAQLQKILEKEKLVQQLNSISGLHLKVWSLCSNADNMKNSTLFDNNFHKIPLAFGIYDSNNNQIFLNDSDYRILKDNLFIKDIENSNIRSIMEYDNKFDSFVRCANGDIPSNVNLANVFFIKNIKNGAKKLKISTFLKIDGMHQEITAKSSDYLKIPVKISSQIEKDNLFEDFKHVFKVENILTKEKFKYMTSKYNGKYKNNDKVNLFIQRIILTDKENKVINFIAKDAKLENNIKDLNSLFIGNNKLLQNIAFFELKSNRNEVENIFEKYFRGSNLLFSGVKDYNQVINSIQKDNSIGILIKIDNNFGSEEHAKITIELEGIDSFGNPFMAKIEDSKW